MTTAIKRSLKPELLSIMNLVRRTTSKYQAEPRQNLTRIKARIRSDSNPDRLTSLFLSAFANPRFRTDHAIYKVAIKKLSKFRRPDLIERILETQKSYPNLPRSELEELFTRIMLLYSDAGMVDHAIRTFDSISTHSDRTFCGLLTVYLKNKRYDTLLDSFYNVPSSINVKPDVTAYNIVIKGMCENGDVHCAQKLFDEMSKDEVTKPNVVSFNTLLSGYVKKGDKEGYERVLNEMNESSLEGDIATFNIKMSMLCKSGSVAEAEELLDVMSEKNIRENKNTYNTLIDGYCKNGNMEKAMMIYERMKKVNEVDDGGMSPDLDTYAMLIECLVENGDFDKVLDLFNECVNRKLAPPFSLVKGLVESLKKEHRVDEAMDVVAEMNKVVRGDAMDAWKSIACEISI